MYLFILLCRAAPMAYRGSQARGQIGATAASLQQSHSNRVRATESELHHSSQQHHILNSLSEARDGTHNLMVPSQIRFHCATMGTPISFLIPADYPTVWIY